MSLAAVRFICCDCGNARDFEQTILHDALHDACASARASEIESEEGLHEGSDRRRAREREADYWNARAELKGEGWAISERFGVRCPSCKRVANGKLLDRAVGSVGR
jgi:hypothetical protein